MSLWKFPPQHNPWYKMTGLQVTYVANKDKAFEIGKSGSVEDYLKDINEIYL